MGIFRDIVLNEMNFKELNQNNKEKTALAKQWNLKSVGFGHYKDPTGLVWIWDAQSVKFVRSSNAELKKRYLKNIRMTNDFRQEAHQTKNQDKNEEL